MNWASEKSLSVNLKKCKALVIPSSSDCDPVLVHGVEPVKKIKLLGVTFDSKLSWKEHVNSIVSSTSTVNLFFFFVYFVTILTDLI